MKIDDFQNELQQLVRIEAESDGAESALAHSFTNLVLKHLVEAGAAVDPHIAVAYFERQRMNDLC
jgi:hypothetical protein